jgi:hypothetical protein
MKKLIFLIVLLTSGIWLQAQILQNNQIIITAQPDGVYIEPTTAGDCFFVYMEINKVEDGWIQFSEMQFMQPYWILTGKTLTLTLYKYNTAGLNRIGQNKEVHLISSYEIQF